jgi:hypothetical protein
VSYISEGGVALAANGLTSEAIRDTVRDLGCKIENESEDVGFHIWSLRHADLPAGVIIEVESSWIGPEGLPQAAADQCLNDLRLLLLALAERRHPPTNKKWICFYRRPGGARDPLWRGPIDYLPDA